MGDARNCISKSSKTLDEKELLNIDDNSNLEIVNQYGLQTDMPEIDKHHATVSKQVKIKTLRTAFSCIK